MPHFGCEADKGQGLNVYLKGGGFVMLTKSLIAADRMITKSMLLLAAVSISMFCGAQTVTTPTPAAAVTTTTVADAVKPAADSSIQFKSRSPRYHIEAGDTFDLTFDLSPEFNQLAVAVQPDGFVTLRGVGDIKVAGETVPQLTETVKQAYSKF